MSILDILNSLKNILPEESFITEPETSLNELLAFEKKYKLNTTDFIGKNYQEDSIEVDDVYEWLNAYENYLFFDGDLTLINKINPNYEYSAQFLNDDMDKSQVKPEYISKSEEADSDIMEYTSSLFHFTNATI